MDGGTVLLTDGSGNASAYLLLFTVRVQGADYAVAVTDSDADPETAQAQILRLLPGDRCREETDDEICNTVFELFLAGHSGLFEDT